MIDPSRLTTAEPVTAAKARPVFRMVESDRTAGSIPVWDSRPAPQGGVETRASTTEHSSFSDALSYTTQENTAAQEEPFGFFDLLDMVNPLQHIPLVSTLYRSISGDEIKPVAKIIGGTIFGGPAGGAASFANVIIEEETGKDFAGNVIAMVQGESPEWRSTPDMPEQRLNDALAMNVEREALDALPPAALAYADSSAAYSAPKKPSYSAAIEDDRMAGSRPRFRSADDDNNNYYFTNSVRNSLGESLPPREPITRLDIASLPVIYIEQG